MNITSENKAIVSETIRQLVKLENGKVNISEAFARASEKYTWIEEARAYLRLFSEQHPRFGVEYDVEQHVRQLAYDTHSPRHKNKSRGGLRSIVYIEEHVTYGRYTWVTDREAHYFACHNRDSNVLYYEIPGGQTKKINLYRETLKKGRNFPLWVAAIRNEINAERCRQLIERCGEDEYIAALDAETLHEDVDSKGSKRCLLKVKNYSPACPELLIVRVVCPSTDRVYYLKPVDQRAKTCAEAIESTFQTPIQYRHGDVGLTAVDEDGNIIEQVLLNES